MLPTYQNVLEQLQHDRPDSNIKHGENVYLHFSHRSDVEVCCCAGPVFLLLLSSSLLYMKDSHHVMNGVDALVSPCVWRGGGGGWWTPDCGFQTPYNSAREREPRWFVKIRFWLQGPTTEWGEKNHINISIFPATSTPAYYTFPRLAPVTVLNTLAPNDRRRDDYRGTTTNVPLMRIERKTKTQNIVDTGITYYP